MLYKYLLIRVLNATTITERDADDANRFTPGGLAYCIDSYKPNSGHDSPLETGQVFTCNNLVEADELQRVLLLETPNCVIIRAEVSSASIPRNPPRDNWLFDANGVLLPN